MRQAGEVRATGSLDRNGISGNPVEGDQVDRVSTGMEGRTRTGERKRTDREERRKGMQETDRRETAGDCGK